MAEQLELDCYHKAEEDEPKFTLLARDPLAAHMVALWAALRSGNVASALCIFADTVGDPGYEYQNFPEPSEVKISSACDISREMNKWRNDKNLPIYTIHYVA